MSKPGLFAFAAQFAPRPFQVRRGTWIAVGVGLLVLFGLLIWAALALAGWLFGQAQGWMGAAPEAVRGAMEQAEQVVPGAREKLGEFVPALKPPQPRRDVSGTDLGPVARYSGFARTGHRLFHLFHGTARRLGRGAHPALRLREEPAHQGHGGPDQQPEQHQQPHADGNPGTAAYLEEAGRELRGDGKKTEFIHDHLLQ